MSIYDDFNKVVDSVYGYLQRRKRNYQLTFGNKPEQSAVLADLAKFCRANETCFHEDARLHAVAEGRREVWLRIQRHLHLSTDQLMTLYADPSLTRRQED